jgi:hypothetical protein
LHKAIEEEEAYGYLHQTRDCLRSIPTTQPPFFPERTQSLYRATPQPHPHNGRGPKLLAALQRRRPPSRRRKGLPNDATTNEAFVRPLHLLPHVRPHTPIANIRVALIARPVAHHFNLPARTQSSSSTRAPSKTTKTSPTCLSPAVQTPQIHVYEIYAPSPAYDLALKTSLYFPPEHQLEIPILPLTVWASRCAIPDLDDCYGRG